jgi:hypothetical protein
VNLVKDWIQRNYVLLILLLVSAAFHWIWLFNYDYITYGDARVYTPQTQEELIENAFYIYNTSSNTGALELSGGTKLIELVHGFLATHGLYYPISFRLIYLFPIIFLAPIAIYFYAKKYIKSDIGVFIASIVFLFNTYTLILQTAGVLILLANIFTLLALLFYHKFFMEKKSYVNFLGIVLTSFIASTYDFRIFYILAIISSIYVVSVIYLFKQRWTIFGYHIVAMLVVFLLNAHWLLVLVNMSQLSSNSLFSRGVFGSSYFDIFSAMTLFHKFWTGGQPAAFVNQPVPFQSWLIPLAILGGMYFSKEDKKRYFIILLVILGIFLTKQQDRPLADLYGWLYAHFPGFNAFREASKFYLLSSIGFSILIGYFIDGVKNQLNIKPYFKYLIYLVFTGIFIWNGIGLINLTIGTLFIPRRPPEAYKSFNEYVINNTLENYRTLWVPINSKWGVYLNNKPAITMVYLSQASSEDISKSVHYIERRSPRNAVGELLVQNFSQELINRYNIRYAVIPLQDFENEDDFFSDYGKDREYYKNLVSSLPYFKPLEINTTEIDLYENTGAYPKIYLTKDIPNVFNPQEIYPVDFEFLSPVEYEIRINNDDLKNGAYLNFAESFSGSWQLYSKDHEGKLIPINVVHIEDDLHLNVFNITEQSDFQTLYLRYDNQTDYRNGMRISIAVFSGLILILVILKIKNVFK